MTEKTLDYKIENIEVGTKEKFEVTVTEETINEFARISGDYNPLHMDENYASSTKFERRICHGMLLASFFSRLIGMYLPGKNSLYFSQSLKFISPCFIGDKVLVEGEVLDKSLATKIVTLRTTILNKSGKCLVDGQAKVLVRE